MSLEAWVWIPALPLTGIISYFIYLFILLLRATPAVYRSWPSPKFIRWASRLETQRRATVAVQVQRPSAISKESNTVDQDIANGFTT